MAIDFESDIHGEYYASNVATEDAYSAPGTYDIPANYISSQSEQNLVTMIEVVRSYFETISSHAEAKAAHEVIARMISELPFGGTTGTFPADSVAANAQAAGVRLFAKQVRSASL